VGTIKSVRVKIEGPGIVALLNSSELRADLTRRMTRVLAAVPKEKLDSRTTVDVEQVTHDRAVVRVVATGPRALWEETHHGYLARALDAAGGS